MSERPRPIRIPEDLLWVIYSESRSAFPSECCGWLSGPRDGLAVSNVHRVKNIADLGTHPTVPGRGSESAYVFCPADLLALNASFATDEPARIIYHSHPNGWAYMSSVDLKVATSPWGDEPSFPVQQLVVGIDDKRIVESAMFAWSYDDKGFVEIGKIPGPT